MENATFDTMLGVRMVPLNCNPPGCPSDRTLLLQNFQEDLASSGPGRTVAEENLAPP